jgi:hypothetical protein
MLQKSPVLTPSLENLSYILRHREWWPEGFRWNYKYCGHCAIGLCGKLWKIDPRQLSPGLLDSELTWEYSPDYRRIFIDSRGKGGILSWIIPPSMSDVTPEMVARQIDRYLARHG